MDDYDVNTLIESKNEWCARLLSILTPQIIMGFKSIFSEAQKLCIENNEESKYLMTFQNLLINIPKWSQNIVETESRRITEVTNCSYIEDLISCVHIIQLKALSACRVGLKQKKINIEIPSLNNFIHQVYINSARKLYLNIYLFEKDVLPLQQQKNNREIEIIIKDIIINTIRDNIPIENLLRAYLDETEEVEDVIEERHETVIDKEKLEQEKARMKIKREMEENEKKILEEKSYNALDSKGNDNNDDKNGDKDELLNISNEINNLKKELPKLNISHEDNFIKNYNEEDVSLGKETINANIKKEITEDETLKNISKNNEKNNSSSSSLNIENNSDILNINNDNVDETLEIMDLDQIDNIEPDISFDIEELK